MREMNVPGQEDDRAGDHEEGEWMDGAGSRERGYWFCLSKVVSACVVGEACLCFVVLAVWETAYEGELQEEFWAI
jgi:hypothetical protein